MKITPINNEKNPSLIFNDLFNLLPFIKFFSNNSAISFVLGKIIKITKDNINNIAKERSLIKSKLSYLKSNKLNMGIFEKKLGKTKLDRLNILDKILMATSKLGDLKKTNDTTIIVNVINQ